MRTAAEGLNALSAALRAEGGTLADVVRPPEGGPELAQPAAAQMAASGPRARGHEAEYELLLEMIREGVLLHYARGRVTPSEDPDLALLLGDQLYALGLSRLAAMGDLAAVAELADVISLISEAFAADDDQLAGAVWDAGTAAVGWGGDPAHEQAKARARAGRPEAVLELRSCATRLTGRQ